MSEGKKVTKTSAIEAILAEDPKMPGGEIVRLLKERYGIELNVKTLSGYKSNWKRKKWQKDLAGPKKTIEESPEPNLNDLLTFKSKIDSYAEGTVSFKEEYQRVKQLVEEFGGFERVEVLMKYMDKITGAFS